MSNHLEIGVPLPRSLPQNLRKVIHILKSTTIGKPSNLDLVSFSRYIPIQLGPLGDTDLQSVAIRNESSPSLVAQPKCKCKNLGEVGESSKKLPDVSESIHLLSKVLPYTKPSYLSSLLPPRSIKSIKSIEHVPSSQSISCLPPNIIFSSGLTI